MRIVGIILILLSLPALIGWLRANPHQRKWAYAAVGALPFTINAINLDAALISWAGWPGYSKGIILTLLDTLALALLIEGRHPFRNLPLLGPMVAYLLAATLSIAFSGMAMASGFYAFQLLRVLIVFVAVASFAGQPGAIRWLALGLAGGAIFQASVTLYQTLTGAIQASGTMGHQNLLGLMLHFATIPLLALMLAGERHKLIALGVLAGLISVSMGASRGSVGFAAMGVGLICGLSLIRRSSPHKWRIMAVGALALAIIAPVATLSFERRFEAKPLQEGIYDERAALERSANMMWSEHPMGVGANQYVVLANTGGYSARAGVVWTQGSRSANVHNMYLLVAAETGWLGLLTLLSLLGWAIFRGLRFAFANRQDPRGDVVLGATVAIITCAAHGLYEWVFVTYQAQYVFAIALGVIAGLIRQRGVERKHAARLRVLSRREMTDQARKRGPSADAEPGRASG
jgi:O-antigen ligase